MMFYRRSAAAMANELTQRDSRRLIELERVIQKGFDSFMEVGTALMEIQEQKLYLATHKTFDAYCNERWNMSRATAYRRIESAKPVNEVVNSLSHGETNRTPEIVNKTNVNGVLSADPPAIATARAAGKIPAETIVEVTEPEEPTSTEEIAEEHEQAKAQSEDEMSDEDWLETLPLTKKLEGLQLKIFKADAVFWRQIQKARETLKVVASRAWNKQTNGPYGSKLKYFMSLNPPKDWVVCYGEHSCGGTGVTGRLKTGCTSCAGIGYKVENHKKAKR
jgi:hypothetical protein